MAAAMQLNAFVSNMFATGFLDDQFQQVRMHQDGSDPDFVADVVMLFCKDGERIIGELAKLLVGARRVKNACIQFSEVSQEKSRDGCLKTLDALRNDFYDLSSMFQIMLQLEQQVQASPKQ